MKKRLHNFLKRVPLSSSLEAELFDTRALQGLPTTASVFDDIVGCMSSPPFFFFRIFATLFADLFAVRQITVKSEEKRFAVSPIMPLSLSCSPGSKSSRSSLLRLSPCAT